MYSAHKVNIYGSLRGNKFLLSMVFLYLLHSSPLLHRVSVKQMSRPKSNLSQLNYI